MRPVLLLLLLALFSASVATDVSEDEVKHHRVGGIENAPRPKEGKGPLVTGPVSGGRRDVTGSNDVHLNEVSEFAMAHLQLGNSKLHFVQTKAEVQVVAGLMYTLSYTGNDDKGVCQEEHVVVVYDKPWVNERILKNDTRKGCA